jgi:hypothetical protein
MGRPQLPRVQDHRHFLQGHRVQGILYSTCMYTYRCEA